MADQHQLLVYKDIPTKAKIASEEANRTPYATVQQVEEALSDPRTAKRVWKQTVLGFLAFICIVVATIFILVVLV